MGAHRIGTDNKSELTLSLIIWREKMRIQLRIQLKKNENTIEKERVNTPEEGKTKKDVNEWMELMRSSKREE